jgi:hypothetical protein
VAGAKPSTSTKTRHQRIDGGAALANGGGFSKGAKMSYVQDLAKDRDKYLLQRNQLMGAIYQILDANGSDESLNAAKKLLNKIEKSDPVLNVVRKMLGED